MKININNQNRVESVIEEIEKGCRKRLSPSYGALCDILYRAEGMLMSMKVPVKSRKGCAVKIIPEAVCNSYKGCAEGTFVEFTRGSKDWFLTHVQRIQCQNCAYGRPERQKLILTTEAKMSIPSEHAL
jgi:hypothetical protein